MTDQTRERRTVHVLCPECSIKQRGPGFDIPDPGNFIAHWQCPECDRWVVSMIGKTT